MARQLVIVAREHPDLYSYLRERFAGRAQAEVLLSRSPSASAQRLFRPHAQVEERVERLRVL